MDSNYSPFKNTKVGLPKKVKTPFLNEKFNQDFSLRN
jgi:hypothetical protein